MNRAPRHARAFTLLEVTLAAALASMVLVTALMLFGSLDRTQQRLARRYDTVVELARLRVVMDRAFSNLVMAEEPQGFAGKRADFLRRRNEGADSANGESGVRGTSRLAGARSAGTGSSGAANVADISNNPALRAALDRAGAGGDAPKGADANQNATYEEMLANVKPRITLLTDPHADELSRRINERARDVEPADTAKAERFLTSPQRFEVVLAEAPMPDPEALGESVVDARRRASIRKKSLQKGNSADAENRANEPEVESDSTSVEIRSVRGAFELRPAFLSPSRPENAPIDNPRDAGWQLWWVPLPPDIAESDVLESYVGEPQLVANGISYLQWRVFQGRQRQTTYEGRFQSDIPAYIELEIEMVDGLKANWLFELTWTIGSETAASEDESAGGSGNGAGDTPGAGSGSSGGNGSGNGGGVKPSSGAGGGKLNSGTRKAGGSGGNKLGVEKPR